MKRAILVAVSVLTLGILHFNGRAFSLEKSQSGEIKTEMTEQTVCVMIDETLTEMKLEEYIISVVAGEVYPQYNEEALKAQAVAARTYLFYKMQGGGCVKGGDICTEAAHCQAYKSTEKMKTQWGSNFDQYYQRISDAVYETAGEIITYDDKPICAMYHSSSVGNTEDCATVFGGGKPYLVSVKTEISTENSEYEKTVVFTKKEYLEKVNSAFDKNIKSTKIEILTRTSAGRADTVSLDGVHVKATALRKALGLRSTDITVRNNDESVTFTMRGYGHGVGMSQVGAEEMAKSGKTYEEILTHYYQGTQLKKI